MTALYIVGGIILLLVLLLSSPISLRFFYKETMQCTLWIWGVPMRLLPKEEKAVKKTEDKGAKKEKNTHLKLLEQMQSAFKEDGVIATLAWLGEIVKLLTSTVGKAKKGITVRLLRIELLVGGEDAAASAIHFGEVCAVLYPLLSVIGSHIKIKRRQVEVRPAFDGGESAALLDVRCGISLWRMSGALLSAFKKFVCMQLKK